jgi:iron complex outermembrane receptor protein/vitamin B12 transporter
MKFIARCILVVLIFGLQAQLLAASAATVSGRITDSLGASVQNAKVELVEIGGGKVVQSTTSDGSGRYSFTVANEGRFRVRAEAKSFQPAESGERFAGGAHAAEIDLTLSPSMVAREIVVTATGVPIPEEQTGASISVVNEESLATRLNVEEALRVEPGVALDRAGQIGGLTTLRVRGGPSDSNKMLIDGVPVSSIGGLVDFSNLGASGFEKVEMYRGPNSALYGSDAMASVVNITTRRGVTPLPDVEYSIDGGTFDTMHQEGNLGGVWRRFDYFTDASRTDTQNSTPNSEFHNSNLLGNVGWQMLPGTELRATARRSVSAVNSPNAIDLYGIADDGVSREADTSFGVTLENRASARWHNLVRYAGVRLRSLYNNFGPTGICYEPGVTPCGSDGYQAYLGSVTTIRGANGYQTTGAGGLGAIFQYAGTYSDPSLSNRDSIYAQSDFRVNSKLAGLFGFRYEAESGYTAYDSSSYSLKSSAARGNYSYMTGINGGFWNRLYYTAGSGLEDNGLFGFAATPRASLAYFVAKPRDNGILSGTRLSFNFGKGIKEPSIYQETNSVYDVLISKELSPASYGIHPFRAERSRTYDGGVQQTLLNGRARVSVTFFHNEFGDMAEYVPIAGLAEIGVPASVLDQFEMQYVSGAYVNTLSYRALGTEFEAEYHITHNLSMRGGWTYTDAVVQHSFANDALTETFNPLIPNVRIGASSPLVGARPFRVPPHTGYFSVDWSGGRASLRMSGTLVSRRDDSTYLYDINSYAYPYVNGNTLLLPNRNLDPSYQKLDLYGSFRITKRVSAFASMDNLLNQHYYEVFGYPALPFTVRGGMKFIVGGNSWKL